MNAWSQLFKDVTIFFVCCRFFSLFFFFEIASIPHALAGRDVLGAARTGSGKTLCYVIPMLEILFREKWNVEDGLGAIVISPTRELATQIFDGKKRRARLTKLTVF
jgi:superfamily II DNA/RNA helicase